MYPLVFLVDPCASMSGTELSYTILANLVAYCEYEISSKKGEIISLPDSLIYHVIEMP